MKEYIDKIAISILKQKRHKGGIRPAELCDLIIAKFRQQRKEISRNDVLSRIYFLTRNHPDEVYNPEWGILRYTGFRKEDWREEPEDKQKITEDEFYDPFAQWLLQAGKCTRAVALGGNSLSDKWGTPDVVGIWKPIPGTILKDAMELVTAEVKTEKKANNLLPAFGQACAYKLFSQYVYLVIPKQAEEDVLTRIEGLCIINGIGLVVFDNERKSNPEFEQRVAPPKQEPVLFYHDRILRELAVNEKTKELFQ